MRAQLDPKQAMIDKLNEELELMREAGATEYELAQMRLEHGAQVAEAFEEQATDQLEWMDILKDAQGLFIDGFSDEMAEALTDGKANFADFTKTLLKHITKLIIQMMVLRALEAGMSAYNMRGLSDINVTAQRMPIPGAAGGGRINGATLVGERGPELIMPSAPSRILNNHVAGQMSAPSVKVEVINKGTPQKASQTAPQFDGKQWVTSIILEDIARGGAISSGMGSADGLRKRV
jgi:phage-related minor tail protein